MANARPTYDPSTGLLYVEKVPFTQERIDELFELFKSSAPKPSHSQFTYVPAFVVRDRHTGEKVTITATDVVELKKLSYAVSVAWDEDFRGKPITK